MSPSLPTRRSKRSEYAARRSCVALLVDALFRDEVQERTGLIGEAQTFLRSQAEKALADQRIAKELQRAVLQRAVEIDEHVAAGNKMHLAEHRIGDQAMVGEHHPVAQCAIE